MPGPRDKGQVPSAASRLVLDFLDYQGAAKNRSPHTLAAYGRDLTGFSSFLLTERGKEPLLATKHDIRAYVFKLREGLDNVSIARALSAINSFYRWLIREGRLDSNPALSVKAPKLPKKNPRFLSQREAESLLGPIPGPIPGPEDGPPRKGRIAKNSGPAKEPGPIGPPQRHEARDQAMLELLYSTGMRVGELAALDLDDLDFREGSARVRKGKGQKDRLVPVGEPALDALGLWLKAREGYLKGGASSVALFLGRRGGRIQDREARRALSKRLGAKGLDSCYSPHSLRHSFASHMLENGADLKAIQEMLGHASLSSTQRYTHLDLRALRKAYQAHPRATLPEGEDGGPGDPQGEGP
ncbi:MAG: tyrosine recombinase XerC [Deltaproteobacteria bacterium]|jgi:integrase/recombinase XerC|nr:tyrosine recombinase XerC [Deltaproteobacteria bacterium]